MVTAQPDAPPQSRAKSRRFQKLPNSISSQCSFFFSLLFISTSTLYQHYSIRIPSWVGSETPGLQVQCSSLGLHPALDMGMALRVPPFPRRFSRLTQSGHLGSLEFMIKTPGAHSKTLTSPGLRGPGSWPFGRAWEAVWKVGERWPHFVRMRRRQADALTTAFHEQTDLKLAANTHLSHTHEKTHLQDSRNAPVPALSLREQLPVAC